MPSLLVFLAAFAMGLPLTARAAEAPPIRILLFSGQNNHNWRETTPKLKAILETSGRFTLDVTEHPEQCTAATFARYDVLVSDWNTFGKAAVTDWPPSLRTAFLEFVRGGKGFVGVHAGTSSFPGWTEYHQIAAASWGQGTSHGRRHTNTVHIVDRSHPITAGMKDFATFDEYWQSAKVVPDARPLATVTPKPEFGGSGKPEPVAFVTQFGNGRGFTLLLGHDTRAMESPGFTALLRRGTEWAATGSVGPTAPRRLWTWVADPTEPKAYFHPLKTREGTTLTALQPDDHPWHRGLWWSWKFINGLNYWEEDRTTGLSEGQTQVLTNAVTQAADGSWLIETRLSYHPPDEPPVLVESRVMKISAPDADGDYSIDWTSRFKAVGPDVHLDRTPIPGEPGGKGWGGYAGLSARLAAGLGNIAFMNSEGGRGQAETHGKAARWITFTSSKGCMTIFDHAGNPRHPTPWYVAENMPYFSPAPLFHAPLTLASGKSLMLRYRVLVHSQPRSPAQLNDLWRDFSRH